MAGTATRTGRGGWALPLGVAALAGALMVASAGVVRVPSAGLDEAAPAPAPTPELAVTRLEWLPAGSAARERLSLLDPTPLFMPGAQPWANAAPKGIMDRPGGEVASSFPAALAFPPERPARGILKPRPPGTPLGAAVTLAGGRWFDGLARADAPARAPGVVGGAAGRMDVYRIGVAGRLASLALPADAVLATATWRPVELSVLVDEAGEVASPAIVASSGVEEVDEEVRALARRELLPRLLLRPGIYRLSVGP